MIKMVEHSSIMGGDILKFLPEDSTSFNFQKCTAIPERLLQCQLYSSTLDEYISIRVAQIPKYAKEKLNELQCSVAFLARISALTTNNGVGSDAETVCCDLRVKELNVVDGMTFGEKFPQLNPIDITVAHSVSDWLGNYWEQYRNMVVQVPTITGCEVPVKILKPGVIRSMTVTVIYEELNKVEFQDSTNQLSEQLVRDAFRTYKVHVKSNSALDLRSCPFLSAFATQVSFVFVHNCVMTNSQTEIGRVTNQTRIYIRKNHDLSYIRRILAATSTLISPVEDCLPGLEVPYMELSSAFQVVPPRSGNPFSKHYYSGILLSGPSGSGKMHVVSEVGKKYCAKVFTCNLSVEHKSMRQTPIELLTKLGKIFEEAEYSSAYCGYPVIIILQNLETLRVNDTGVAFRTQRNKLTITNCIADFLDNAGTNSKIRVPFVVVGITSKPYMIPEKLRLCHRLYKEIFINVPDISQRIGILKALQKENSELCSLNVEKLAKRTPGYLASDLIRLTNLALLKTRESTDTAVKFEDHIKHALSRVLPSVLQGGIGVITSNTSDGLDQISGLDVAKMNLVQTIIWPLTVPQALERMGIRPPSGIILYGPSGCGKTSLVRAIASAHHSNFISVSSAELFCSGVGDSEKIIAHLFHLARQASPCVLFIDEIDAIVGSREAKSSGGKAVNDMILSMLLTEMDGIGQRHSFAKKAVQGFVVVGATNRPEMIDSALMRPGRFDRLIPVPPPNAIDRLKLLHHCTTNTPLAEDVCFEEIAERTERFSGADIINFCREAGLNALSENIDATVVFMRHYRKALEHCSPSISQDYLNSFYKYASRGSLTDLSSHLSSLTISTSSKGK